MEISYIGASRHYLHPYSLRTNSDNWSLTICVGLSNGKSYHLSIIVFPKLWYTELICTEYARNYLLTLVPVNSSQLTQVPIDSSYIILSVDQRQNYLTRVLFDLSHRRLSVDRRWNYLARVLVVCPSTNIETVDSHPSRLSLDRPNL